MRESHLEISVWDRIFDLPTPEPRLDLYHPAILDQDNMETHPKGLGFSYAQRQLQMSRPRVRTDRMCGWGSFLFKKNLMISLLGSHS